MYDVLKALQNGEQNREFDEETYNQLIKSNSDLKDSFVQIGDKFKYIGGSMDHLSDTLIVASKKQMHIAQTQM
jgi:hypothetical protein